VAEKDRVFEASKMPHIRGADFISIYANSAHIAVGFYDISIVFSQISPTLDGTPAFQDKAIVAMSLEHAKALVDALRGTIEGYEKENGPIRSRRKDGTADVEITEAPRERLMKSE